MYFNSSLWPSKTAVEILSLENYWRIKGEKKPPKMKVCEDREEDGEGKCNQYFSLAVELQLFVYYKAALLLSLTGKKAF